MINNLMLKYTYKLSNFLSRTTKHQLQKLQLTKSIERKQNPHTLISKLSKMEIGKIFGKLTRKCFSMYVK